MINNIWKETIYKNAISIWGERSQYEMAQEEATELALAVRKHIRNNDNVSLEDLAGEMADVEIMIEQIKLMNPTMNVRVQEIKLEKLERLERRLTSLSYE